MTDPNEYSEVFRDTVSARETWVPVASFPGYEVSDLGRVRSLPRPRKLTAEIVQQVLAHAKGGETQRELADRLGISFSSVEKIRKRLLRTDLSNNPKILTPSPNDKGYLRVFLCRGSRAHTRYVHILVASAFHGPAPEDMEVNHKDTNKANNRADNLEYMTRLENVRHATALGLLQKVLSRDQYLDIAMLSESGLSGAEIGRRYGIAKSTACRIIKHHKRSTAALSLEGSECK